MIHNSNNTQNDFVICNCNSTEYMIPAGNGNKYKFLHADCFADDTSIMNQTAKNRVFVSDMKELPVHLRFYNVSSANYDDSFDKEAEITAYLYKEGISFPIGCSTGFITYSDLKFKFNDVLSQYSTGDFFVLIADFSPERNDSAFTRMGECLRYSFRVLPGGDSLQHPSIKDVTIKPLHNSTRYCSDAISVTFRSDIAIQKHDIFTISCYTKELFLMAQAEITATMRTLKTRLASKFIWLPGEYTCYIEHNSEPFGRIDFTMSENQFTCNRISRVSPGDNGYNLIKHIEKEYHSWHRLRDLPGCLSLKQAAINNFPMQNFNREREQNMLTAINMNLNYAIIGNETSDSKDMLNDFACTFNYNDPFLYHNCTEFLCNNANETPDEQINSIFDICDRNVLCLTGLSAINSPKGIYIINNIEKRLSTKPDFPLLLLGSEAEIEHIFQLNPKLRRNFPSSNILRLSSYSCSDIIHTMQSELEKQDLIMSPRAEDAMARFIMQAHLDKGLDKWTRNNIVDFINCSIIPEFSARMTRKNGLSYSAMKTLECCDFDFSSIKGCSNLFNDSIKELNGMIGMKELKKNLIATFNLTRFNSIRKQRGLKSLSASSHHMIFTGNPGTGKTTVAKMIGAIYRSMGILSKGDVIVTERSRMVGRYIGETEQNMNILLQQARGNVLFVDEAYTLRDTDQDRKDFGYHALESLLTVLSQKEPDMIIIFAGYKNEIERMLKANQGLSGRFPYHFHFDDYTADELLHIAKGVISRDEYFLTEEAEELLAETIAESVSMKDEDFSNARWVTQYVENGIIPAMANRLIANEYLSTESCQTITAEDIATAYPNFRIDRTASVRSERLDINRLQELPRVGFRIA